jgi:hypothetical protein
MAVVACACNSIVPVLGPAKTALHLIQSVAGPLYNTGSFGDEGQNRWLGQRGWNGRIVGLYVVIRHTLAEGF